MDKVANILVSDNDSHWYIIPESEQGNFDRWIEGCDSGKFAAMKKFDYFDKCRVDLPRLKIYDWSEE